MQQENNNFLSLRPLKLENYIGQEKLKQNLKVYIKAAIERDEPLDHVLLFGPPGLGKTTMAKIIAYEMGKKIHIINGANIEKQGDIASLLASIQPGEVLFIDEIHRLSKPIEEILYHAMEDFILIVTTGEARTNINIQLPPFTIIGATTNISSISAPLKSRFPIVEKINFYSLEEIEKIIYQISKILQTPIDAKTANMIAKRSRGTPRIAINLFKRVRDFANAQKMRRITPEIAITTFKNIKLNELGLYDTDIEYLKTIALRFHGGPVGLKTIAFAIGESAKNIEEVYEPYLVKIGFINKNPKGRILTKFGMDFLQKLK